MIRSFHDLTEAARLTDFYNDEFTPLPYYYEISPEEFHIGVRYQEEKSALTEPISCTSLPAFAS